MPGKMLVDNPKGKPVRDSKKDYLVKVTATDIRRAVPHSPTKCAIANGCKRVDGVVAATINKSVSYLEFPDEIVRLFTPQAAAREVIALDRGGAFQPGEFWLKAPWPSSRLGKRPGRPRGKANGSRGKRRNGRHITVMVRGA